MKGSQIINPVSSPLSLISTYDLILIVYYYSLPRTQYGLPFLIVIVLSDSEAFCGAGFGFEGFFFPIPGSGGGGQ